MTRRNRSAYRAIGVTAHGKRESIYQLQRDDAAGFSRAIYEWLVEHLPREQAYMDVAGIGAVEDSTAKLEQALAQFRRVRLRTAGFEGTLFGAQGTP